jgi:hypothetical protein
MPVFLFTAIEDSTRLGQELGAAMSAVLAEVAALYRTEGGGPPWTTSSPRSSRRRDGGWYRRDRSGNPRRPALS